MSSLIELVLLQDVLGLGKAGDTITVRNQMQADHFIKVGLAKSITESTTETATPEVTTIGEDVTSVEPDSDKTNSVNTEDAITESTTETATPEVNKKDVGNAKKGNAKK